MSLVNQVALSFCFSLVLVACAVPNLPHDADDGTSRTKKKAASKAAAEDESGDDADDADTEEAETPARPPTVAAPTAASCQKRATHTECTSCCDEVSGGALARASSARAQCACSASGACAKACGTAFCVDGSTIAPRALCDQCVESKCASDPAAACSSAACQEGAACAEQCAP